MKNIPIILTFISGFATLLGYFITYYKTKRKDNLIVFCLSLSLGIMSIVSIFELIPYSLKYLINNYNLIFGILISFLVFLLGYLTINVIDLNLKNESSLKRIGVLNLLSLFIHNVPEGIIVYINANNNINLGIKMCIAILFHNIPEGIAISIPLFYSNESRGKILTLTLIASIAEPIGAILTHLLLKNIINNTIIAYIQIFTAGLMLSLSITKILKEAKSYNNNKYLYYGLITSALISLFLLFL